MTNSNSLSPNETKNLISCCLILKKHNYKWVTIGGKNKELSRSHWHIWIIAKIFKSYCSTVHFRRITSIYQPMNAHIISHKTFLKHSDMFWSCQIIIRELCSLLKLYYSIHNSIRICKRGVVRRTPSHCSTTHSHTTWYAATTSRLQIRNELWIL